MRGGGVRAGVSELVVPESLGNPAPSAPRSCRHLVMEACRSWHSPGLEALASQRLRNAGLQARLRRRQLGNVSRGSARVFRAAMVLAFLFAAAVAFASDSCAKQVPYLVNRSLIIAAAKVVNVGRAPGFWSEVLPALQSVRYDVLATYKGKLADKQITVDHKVVSGSRLVEKHPPGLSKQYFAVGNELILFLQTPSQDIGDECAVEHRSAALERQIQDLVRAPIKNP